MLWQSKITDVITVLCRRWEAPHRHVFTVLTAVNTPASMSTVSYRSLSAGTVHVVQPNRPVARPISVAKCLSCVPEISNIIDVHFVSKVTHFAIFNTEICEVKTHFFADYTLQILLVCECDNEQMSLQSPMKTGRLFTARTSVGSLF